MSAFAICSAFASAHSASIHAFAAACVHNPTLDNAIAFARGHACHAVQAGARPTAGQRKCGWEKAFEGFEPTWTQFVKDLA